MKQALILGLAVLFGVTTLPFAVSAATATKESVQNPSAYELVAARRVVIVKKRGMGGRGCIVRKRVVKMGGVKRVRKVKVCR